VVGARSAGAQETVAVGIKGGVNAANVTGDFGIDTNKRSRTVGVFGAYLAYRVSALVDIQPEFLYSMEGTKLAFFSGSTATQSLDIFRIPVLLRVGPRPGQYASCCYFFAGPALGLVLRAKQDGPGTSDFDLKDQLRRGDLSALGGAGLTISRFHVEARYTAGLTRLSKEANARTITRVLSVMGGVKF
jgi:hypothetical protein